MLACHPRIGLRRLVSIHAAAAPGIYTNHTLKGTVMRNLALPLVLLCAACSSTFTPPAQVSLQSPIVVGATVPAAAPAPTDPLAKLAAFTLADLQAADVDAIAQTPPDTTSDQCYKFLIQILPTIKVPGSGQTVGAIMAFQKLRDLQNGVTASNGTLKSLNLACAPLVISTQTTINQLGLIAGGTAITASTGLPLLAPLP
jgi:hypothetical protein